MVQRFNFALRACRYAHTHTRKSDKANGDELTHTRRKKKQEPEEELKKRTMWVYSSSWNQLRRSMMHVSAEHAKRWKKTRKLLTQISWIKSKCYRFFSSTLTLISFFFVRSFIHFVIELSCPCNVMWLLKIEGNATHELCEQRIAHSVLFDCVRRHKLHF